MISLVHKFCLNWMAFKSVKKKKKMNIMDLSHLDFLQG